MRFPQRNGPRRAATSIALAASLVATAARATGPLGSPSEADIQTARALFNEGMDFRDQHMFDEALAKLRLAHSLGRTPITGYELATTLRMKGKFLEALEVFREVERLPRAEKESDYSRASRANAVKSIAEIGPLLAVVTVALSAPPPGTTVTLDSAPLPIASLTAGRKIDPGSHTLAIVAPGYKPINVAFDAKPGESKAIPATLVLIATAGNLHRTDVLPAEGASRSHGWRTVGVSSLAFAGVGAVLGTVGGVVATGAASTADERCAGVACPSDAFDRVSSGRTFATLSTVGFVLAGVGAAFGVTALVLDGNASNASRRESRLRLTASGIGGVF